MTELKGRKSVIAQIECFPVTIPIEAPILTSYGSLKSYARSIIRLTTEDGYVGYGDVSARIKSSDIDVFRPLLQGLNVWETTPIARRIRNWNYYPWTKPEPLIAAIEMACLDIQGKIVDLPLYELLGGKVRDTVPVAGYMFYRHANEEGEGEIHNADQMIDFAHRCVEHYGFRSLKVKGGYFSPEQDRETLTALRDTFGRDMGLRIDPQGSWSIATAIRIGRQLETLNLDYFEDPVWGAAGMAEVRKDVRIPLATNMCVTQFEELAGAYRMGAVDVILSDLWYWGGIKPSLQLERICSTFGLDIGTHSGTELAIGWAAMIHTAAAMPSMRLSADYMNMHLLDDISVEPRIVPVDGVVRPPEAPGLGITVDEKKLEQYSRLAASGEADDRFLDPAAADSARPGWFPEMPAW
ncbi:MAG: enolase C-terminal domain-like protein [Pseudomonadota bacterium]